VQTYTELAPEIAAVFEYSAPVAPLSAPVVPQDKPPTAVVPTPQLGVGVPAVAAAKLGVVAKREYIPEPVPISPPNE